MHQAGDRNHEFFEGEMNDDLHLNGPLHKSRWNSQFVLKKISEKPGTPIEKKYRMSGYLNSERRM